MNRSKLVFHGCPEKELARFLTLFYVHQNFPARKVIAGIHIRVLIGIAILRSVCFKTPTKQCCVQITRLERADNSKRTTSHAPGFWEMDLRNNTLSPHRRRYPMGLCDAPGRVEGSNMMEWRDTLPGLHYRRTSTAATSCLSPGERLGEDAVGSGFS
ncbi:hypothetical protein CDAR_379051 [Caerostris darwini]|uniref:Uncharacterized protein n=1 Tax=Caerostris darwini TaxID=1538125 RepID=A0AAV4TZ85_9ARAC|nr:hypothetical protein CDAR_379051 [Caerostris darwini]